MIFSGICFLLLRCVVASQNVFSVSDDVFAYPQYEIEFSPSYILEEEAANRLHASNNRHRPGQSTIEDEQDSEFEQDDEVGYERMRLNNRQYLCSIPYVEPTTNSSKEQKSKDEQKNELIHAADRGWQLLSDMEGKQCLYYSTGWWSYSFCYNSHVKQFHALPASNGAPRPWPPQEDQSTPSYILGQYESKSSVQNSGKQPIKQEVAELQSRADGNYLVQRLEGGTPCDLTGRNRRVEIEFHCHPQTTDRIGWIKETTTCAYLMVIYTPRLCNDLAFLPTRDSQAHTISCREILTISEAAHLHTDEHEAVTIETAAEKPIVIGRVEVGAMKYIGKDGKKLERGRIVMTPDEKAEVIIMQKDGQIQSLTRSKMKELNIEPEDIEEFKRELQKIAGSKDWKIERLQVGDGNGQIQLRGIVSNDNDGGETHYEAVREDEEQDGSEEEYKTKP